MPGHFFIYIWSHGMTLFLNYFTGDHIIKDEYFEFFSWISQKCACHQDCLVYLQVNNSYFLYPETDKQTDQIKMAGFLITHCISMILIKIGHTLFCG